MFETTVPKVNNFMHSFLSEEEDTYLEMTPIPKVSCTLCNKTTKLIVYEASAWCIVGSQHGNCQSCGSFITTGEKNTFSIKITEQRFKVDIPMDEMLTRLFER
jgi:hypothetical protein